MTGIVHDRIVASRDKGMAVDWNADHNITGDTDMDQHSWKNQVIENLVGFPGGAVEGQIIWRSDLNITYVYDGMSWVPLGALSYETGWINTNDWTNRHLGTVALPKNTDSNVTHHLSAPLRQLIVKVFISTDGTDATSFEVQMMGEISFGGATGITPYQVNLDNIKVQTSGNGFIYIRDNGGSAVMDNEDWWYNIVVYKIQAT